MRSFTQKDKLSVTELTTFAMLGTMMYITKFIMAILPNIHLIALFIAAFTLTYRVKALFPIYVFIFLDIVTSGFALGLIPNLYIWFPLWAGVMLVSKIKIPNGAKVPVYMVVCGLHGLGFGAMYAPAQALMFGYDLDEMLVWIAAGFPFDVIHGASNFCAASLVLPLNTLLEKMSRNTT